MRGGGGGGRGEARSGGGRVDLYHPPSNLTLPEMVDWHTKGAVSSVVDQVRMELIID